MKSLDSALTIDILLGGKAESTNSPLGLGGGNTGDISVSSIAGLRVDSLVPNGGRVLVFFLIVILLKYER